MNNINVGIIGNGFVGNALYNHIKHFNKVFVYDADRNKCYNTLEETLKSELIFVCLPTPMKDANGADCNTEIIEKFFISIPLECNSLFVIKSTVPIGTTKVIKNLRKDLKIVHNPEFLTANNAIEDFKNSDRNIIGGTTDESMFLKSYLEYLFPNSTSILVDSDESEAIKYFCNTFLATKVIYFNMVNVLSNKLQMNYNNLLSGICSDRRIGFSHTMVPGPDGEMGFGGTCFPKDINALINTYEKNNLNCDILKEIWKYNKNIRKNWDWANSKSAVYNGE